MRSLPVNVLCRLTGDVQNPLLVLASEKDVRLFVVSDESEGLKLTMSEKQKCADKQLFFEAVMDEAYFAMSMSQESKNAIKELINTSL